MKKIVYYISNPHASKENKHSISKKLKKMLFLYLHIFDHKKTRWRIRFNVSLNPTRVQIYRILSCFTFHICKPSHPSVLYTVKQMSKGRKFPFIGKLFNFAGVERRGGGVRSRVEWFSTFSEFRRLRKAVDQVYF